MTFSELFKSFLLGLIQGLSEFLPISSSGHLVLAGWLFHVSHISLLFILVLHLGSLMAIFSFYYSDILLIFKQFIKKPFQPSKNNRLICLVFVATLPSLPGSFLLLSLVEKSLNHTDWIGVGFLLTASCLFFTRWPLKKAEILFSKDILSNPKQSHTLSRVSNNHLFSFQKAFIIGLSQVLAFFPGMSRSGLTISTALFLGLPKKQAVFFSFLLAIPAICGALVFKIIKEESFFSKDIFSLQLAIAFFSSWIFGYLALKWLIRSIQNLSFPIFAFYLWPLGLIVIMKDLL